MNYLSQVQKGIDFIEANLDFDFTLKQVAEEAKISQWHFQRIFKALSNETLKTYIRSRRLTTAFEKLLKTDQKIIEIAVTAGFESQESFTRAFKKAFDMTPNEARKIASSKQFLKKVEFDREYLQHIHQNVSLEPEIITRKKKLFIGLKTHFYSVDSEKNNIAEQLPSLWGEFLPRMQEIKNTTGSLSYGIIQATKANPDLLEYYAVCEVSNLKTIPKGMVIFEIPQTCYAQFTHKGDVRSINNTVNYIYSSWLMQSDYCHSYGADLEIYGDTYIAESDDSIVHYAIPISERNATPQN